MTVKTNEHAELSMRVKALEADVAALQRQVNALARLAEESAEDLATLDRRTDR